jgi:hypothetical protein
MKEETGMRRLIGIAILLAAGPLMAQEITIDYAKDVDFAAVKTFQYSETEDTNVKDPMVGERIVADLKAKLVEGGLTEVQDSPDIYVTYHVMREEKQKLHTQTFGYGGYSAGWGRWADDAGKPASITTETPYTEGTLIVDAYRATDKKMIWRGTGVVTLASKPKKQEQQVQKILNKMGHKWGRILRNAGE